MRTLQSGPVALCLALLMGCGARAPAQAADPAPGPALPPARAAAAPSGPCLPGAAAFLRASLRGAVNAELDWTDAQLTCEGSSRPDGQGHGLRVTIAGPLPAQDPAAAPPRLRFVFGIDTSGDAAPARARPTNLTVIFEGQQQLFATRGDGHCTTDRLLRSAVEGGVPGGERIEARGFCTAPASTLDGGTRLLVTTFDFAAGVKPEEPAK